VHDQDFHLTDEVRKSRVGSDLVTAEPDTRVADIHTVAHRWNITMRHVGASN